MSFGEGEWLGDGDGIGEGYGLGKGDEFGDAEGSGREIGCVRETADELWDGHTLLKIGVLTDTHTDTQTLITFTWRI